MTVEEEISARFPRVREYVRGLPDGLASHPSCQVKSSLVRALLPSSQTEALEGLPAVVLDIVRDPKPISSWISHVHGHAVLCALRDVVFENDKALARSCYEAQVRLFSSPAYKLLMIAASPSLVLRAVQARWSAFNRGTSVKSRVDGDGGEVRVRHPVGLFAATARTSVCEALRASLELARGAHGVDVEVAEVSDVWFSVRASWQGSA